MVSPLLARHPGVPGYFDRVVLETVESRPDLMFVSDGDPDVTVPEDDYLPEEIRGTFRPSMWSGFTVRRY